ncbi:MAG: hypothetical protein AAF074_18920 [Pseudomonadota bacterium]
MADTAAPAPAESRGASSPWPDALSVAAMLALAVLFYLPSLVNGPPIGDSYHFNLAWAASFAEALAAGDPYPRWLHGMWDGAGGPDFYFYAPLPFYLSATALALCGCGAAGGLSLAMLALHFASGLGAWWLAAELGLKRIARLAAALGFMAMPYHLIDWSVRHAVGELAAAACIGFLLGAFVRVLREGRGHVVFGVATALMALSHLPSLITTAVVCACLLPVFRRSLSVGRLAGLGLTGLLGVLAAAVYWLPAITLLDTVSRHYLDDHFWGGHLLTPTALFLGGTAGHVYLAGLGLTLAAVAALLAARAALRERWGGADPDALRLIVVTLASCWVMMTPLSIPLWFFTPIGIIQFPWRFMLIADLALALAFGLAVALASEPQRARRLAGVAAVAMAVVIALGQPPWWRSDGPNTRFDFLLEARAGPFEWIPATAPPHDFTWPQMTRTETLLAPLDDPRTLRIAAGKGATTLLEEGPRRLRFAADCPEGCTVVVRRTAWAFWRLEADAGEAPAIAQTDGYPLIELALPPGGATYRLVLERPVTERIAVGLSLAALLAAAAMLLLLRRRKAAGRAA